jgi:carotenoid cleavage dioxygenase
MQCDFQYRPPQNEWPTGFNGDGHVSRFNFKDGNVNFRSRYVKTARLMAERAAAGQISSRE